MQETA
jgi:nucleolar complex protein 2